ncbi:shikimate kinase [Rhodothalassium salexigens]|uniref:shikimate kinase n=1 Tax=Rhodothalassium salexigens TaxID=1086 RepID=UPI001913A01B|nr:shikimate kinase [Rhodothalassium salexigens]MBK5921935.1 shikimate kinase [Rhodothalassium salexigens]
MTDPEDPDLIETAPVVPDATLDRPIALVGMMGCGKSTVGRRLARRLALPFVDSDQEVETAAGCPVSEVFERFGEAAFRQGEYKVLARLLDGRRKVIATGGGAFAEPGTRALIRARAVTVWLKADLDTLVARTARRDTRPLLRGADPRATLARLLDRRTPDYALADIHVVSADGPHGRVVDAIIDALTAHLEENTAS